MLQAHVHLQPHTVNGDSSGEEDAICLATITLLNYLGVPTPFDHLRGHTSLSAIYETLRGLPDGKTIVVKSTVPPGTCGTLQEEFPHHVVFHNPEFLLEKTAYQDFISPKLQVVGCACEGQERQAQQILALLPRAPVERIVRATDSELLKLAMNAFLSMKVIFGNQIHDLSQAVGVHYDTVAEPSGGPAHRSEPPERMARRLPRL